MPAVEDVIQIEQESSERLGALWRSQGEDFLDAQAVALFADIDRMRDSYIKGVERSAVIDLRDWDVTGMVCSRVTHSNDAAAVRCRNCRQVFCSNCVVRPEGADAEPLCTECALVLGGVHHKRSRSRAAPARPGRATRH